jgi:short-subunit dehydrogenase
MKNFKEKYGPWALVTGGTSGIGEAISHELASMGMNIVLVARKTDALESKAATLKARYHIDTQIISADLSTNEGVENVKALTTELSIGLLAIAAGFEVNGAFEKNDIQKELNVIQININATLQLTHHFSQKMIQIGKGGIILVASLSGHMPNPYFANYAGTKAYVLNFGASLYGELKPKGVDVTVLSPGLTNTPMIKDNGVDWTKTPMQALSAGKVAKTAVHALGKKFLAIPGTKNKIMAAMAKHSPLAMQAKMNEKMMKRAISPGKL